MNKPLASEVADITKMKVSGNPLHLSHCMATNMKEKLGLLLLNVTRPQGLLIGQLVMSVSL